MPATGAAGATGSAGRTMPGPVPCVSKPGRQRASGQQQPGPSPRRSRRPNAATSGKPHAQPAERRRHAIASATAPPKSKAAATEASGPDSLARRRDTHSWPVQNPLGGSVLTVSASDTATSPATATTPTGSSAQAHDFFAISLRASSTELASRPSNVTTSFACSITPAIADGRGIPPADKPLCKESIATAECRRVNPAGSRNREPKRQRTAVNIAAAAVPETLVSGLAEAAAAVPR
mmetsp:Transcript_2463/g.9712  ORF Transcript_2463/g.9712 Transcript_2463/m.9712 type:complete len:236 (+) Transcript_2463:923-1630(+)